MCCPRIATADRWWKPDKLCVRDSSEIQTEDFRSIASFVIRLVRGSGQIGYLIDCFNSSFGSASDHGQHDNDGENGDCEWHEAGVEHESGQPSPLCRPRNGPAGRHLHDGRGLQRNLPRVSVYGCRRAGSRGSKPKPESVQPREAHCELRWVLRLQLHHREGGGQQRQAGCAKGASEEAIIIIIILILASRHTSSWCNSLKTEEVPLDVNLELDDILEVDRVTTTSSSLFIYKLLLWVLGDSVRCERFGCKVDYCGHEPLFVCLGICRSLKGSENFMSIWACKLAIFGVHVNS